jgi:hypothetical protein
MTATRLFCLAALAAWSAAAIAGDPLSPVRCDTVCPQCGCQEQIVYKDCITHRCRLVPDNRPIKKTVYEVKEVPFCLPKLPSFCSLFHHKGCCDSCGCVECECPRYKKVLVKKEIVCGEICGYKCEVEEVVTRVPCRQCTPGCPSCTQAVPSAPPPGAPQAPVPPAPEPTSVSDLLPPPLLELFGTAQAR